MATITGARLTIEDPVNALIVSTDEGEIRLPFSPKEAHRMKRFFGSLGLGDVTDLDFDDETLELLEPAIVGMKFSL